VESLRRLEPDARPSKLVEYCCVFAGHWKKTAPAQWTNTLTIQRGAWAFCPFDVLEGGHEWAATGGISVDRLRRLVRRGKPAEFKAKPAPPKQNGSSKRNGVLATQKRARPN